jgi:aldose 1-epimerase
MTIQTVEKEGVTFITIVNAAGLSLTLSDFGAAIYEIRYQNAPMNIAETDKKTWLTSSAYFGKSVGRIAGRINGGVLHYQGKDYQLDVNEGSNTLHGGKGGFSFLPFKMDVVRLDEAVAVDFYLTSKAGDMGFPGEVALRVRYLIQEDEASFKILYDSKVSEETPLNFTCHAYFNLGGDETVEAQRLWIDAEKTETYGPSLIPLGFVPSPRCLDFTEPKAVGQDIMDPYLQKSRALGYDHCFAFKDNRGQAPVLRLESAKYGMEITTSLPGVQVYSDNYPRLGALLNNGHREKQHSGLAIEPVYLPDDFTSMSAVPGTNKHDWIAYHFYAKER